MYAFTHTHTHTHTHTCARVRVRVCAYLSMARGRDGSKWLVISNALMGSPIRLVTSSNRGPTVRKRRHVRLLR